MVSFSACTDISRACSITYNPPILFLLPYASVAMFFRKHVHDLKLSDTNKKKKYDIEFKIQV